MIYYGIRHKPSGKLLPQIRRKRGNTHSEPEALKNAVPRLFRKASSAKIALTYWLQGIWVQEFSSSYFEPPEYDGNSPKKVESRKREEMEIVPIRVSIGGRDEPRRD